MDDRKGGPVLPSADLLASLAAPDLERLANRIDRSRQIVAGAAMTADEQAVFDMLGDDDPCEQ